MTSLINVHAAPEQRWEDGSLSCPDLLTESLHILDTLACKYQWTVPDRDRVLGRASGEKSTTLF